MLPHTHTRALINGNTKGKGAIFKLSFTMMKTYSDKLMFTHIHTMNHTHLCTSHKILSPPPANPHP